jgi:Ni,Fe-hydrogenase III large subunit
MRKFNISRTMRIKHLFLTIAMLACAATVNAQSTNGEKVKAFADKYLNLSGYIQGGFSWDKYEQSTFYLKRARVSLTGDAAKEKIDYRLQVDMAGSPKICDLYFRYKPLKQLNLQLGQFKLPFALENELCGPTTFEFIEYSYITTYLNRNNGLYDGIASTGRDIGFQLYQVACEALRTVTINTSQAWCGNRFGKSMIRPFGTNHPLTEEKIATIRKNVAEVRRRYNEVREDILESQTLLARFEQCGLVPRTEMVSIGGVGMAARSSSLLRDIRKTHPWGLYATEVNHEPVLKSDGDVMSRLATRLDEVLQSADYIESVLANYSPAEAMPTPNYEAQFKPNALSFSLIEGWRGEICHVALTDEQGNIAKYKIKDPSLHNWLGLAIAVRSEGISDFPINNKSFNLSYCGHDL